MPGSVSRRDFLKFGGFAGVGAAASGLGIAGLAGCSADKVITQTDFVYTCPVCGTYFTDYDELVKHFEQKHPERAVPQCAELSINNETY